MSFGEYEACLRGEARSADLSRPRRYPPWFSSPRPSNAQLPTTYNYGGAGFTIDLSTARAPGTSGNITSAKVRIIRTGFSTHAIQWGQRVLEFTSRIQCNGTAAKLVVDALPDNRNLFAPGPALAFLEINGVPSKGRFVQIGPRQIPAERRGVRFGDRTNPFV